ncbi:MAG: hypothetical protein ACREGJ_04850 [Candidatus Saccharimonadales bacterium]
MASPGINQEINFQGRLLNAQGATVPDGNYNIQFKIYQDGDGQTVGNTTGTPAGSLKWTEDHLNANGQGVQVKNGFMSVQLGSITAFGSSIDWNQDTLWLSMNIGSTNGTCTPFSNCTPDGEMTPMKRLSSIPYSLNSGLLGGLSKSQFIQSTTTPQTANIAIQSSSASSISALVQGATSQTADILQVKADGTAEPLLAVSASGAVKLRNATDSATAFQVQNAAGTSLFTVDTTTGNVSVGAASQQGSLVIHDGNGQTTTLQAGDSAGNLTFILPPSTAVQGGHCLKDTTGTGVLGFQECSTGSSAFVQGGNSFGATAVLGTIDANALELRTNNNTVLSFNGISGAATLQNTSDSSSALKVNNAAGSSVLTVDTSAGQVVLGNANTLNASLVFRNNTNSNTTTLTAAAASTNQSIAIPNASGTVCLTSGNCAGLGGNGDVLQGGNSVGAAITIGTNDNYNFSLETNNQTRLTVDTSGNVGIGDASTGDRLSVTSAINNSTIYVDDDFDPSIDSAEWSSTSNVSTDTTCGAAGSVSGNALRFNGSGTRSAATIDMNTANGGTVSFYIYSSNQSTSGCESTEGGENMALEYSNNSGGSWTEITTYNQNSQHTISKIDVPIPSGAQTSATRFRWRQVAHSGNNFDNWTLDNVIVTTVNSANTPAALYVYNGSTSSEVDLLRVASDIGGTANIKLRVKANGDVFSDGTYYGAGGVTAGSADLAEVYRNNDDAQPGDVVVFTDSRTVEKSNKAYQTSLAGVVSTKPGFTLNVNETGVPVALSGRVPVKVSVANGSIQRGDYLTSSPDGKAQKATAAGPTIGTALEDATEDGTIEVFVHLGHYDPVDEALAQDNLFALQSSDTAMANLNVSGNATVGSLYVSNNAYVGGVLTVGTAKITATLTVGGRIISQGKAVTPQALSALGYGDQAADQSVVANGTDTAGTITFTTGAAPVGGELVKIAFSAQYETDPRIVLEPNNAESAHLKTFVTKTKDGFILHTTEPPQANQTYSFDYIIIGSNVAGTE